MYLDFLYICTLSGEIVTTIPTIGFNVETVEYKNISFTVKKKKRVGGFIVVFPRVYTVQY